MADARSSPLTTEVVLCTYNGRRFVEEQLRSIVAQTHPVDRITIRDDASQDGTVEFVRAWSQALPDAWRGRVEVVVNTSNLGYAANFSLAVAGATQDVLFLCDQDDVWVPHKVAALLHELEETGADMVASDGFLMDELGHRIGSLTVLQTHGLGAWELATFRQSGFRHLLRQNYINGAAVAIRRAAAQAALPLPCDMPHDYWLALWCAVHGGIALTPEPLYGYRQHAGNAIGMGPANLLYVWLGVWRHARAPRQRDLHIWRAVTGRLGALPARPEVDLARGKLAWLDAVVGTEGSRPGRAWRILGAALRGQYRRFGPHLALSRDLVSLLR